MAQSLIDFCLAKNLIDVLDGVEHSLAALVAADGAAAMEHRTEGDRRRGLRGEGTEVAESYSLGEAFDERKELWRRVVVEDWEAAMAILWFSL
ncbi:hypothetical protein L484_010510 [Morus notabilis]|uniref:Uncharacterized protein n=1 Tax=Morus notabilis TaxID=981085 RepID=W9QZX7_9ROSA|nr:hypothetical protein L484_010510 [Morus notabilis]